MKLRLYLASGIVLCLVSILVFLGAENAQRSLRLGEEIHVRSVPSLRHLEQMRFGILRIVSSTSELMVAHLTGADDEAGPESGKATSAEVGLIEQGSEAYRNARENLLALYPGSGAPTPAYADIEAIDRGHARLAATSGRIIALVHAHASPAELAEAKEAFEVQEMEALAAIAQALDRTQHAADAQYAELSAEIDEMRNQNLGLGLLGAAVLASYTFFVIRLLQREAKARREAEQLAAAHAAEIERRRNIEDRLAAHQKMEALGTMIGGIAHSVNNLLVPIVTLSKMLKQDAPPGSELQQDLGRILASGENASKLLKDVLAFSRTGEAAPAGSCELAGCLRRTLSLARAALPASVELHVALPAEGFKVPIEESEIDAIVFSLLNNAVDAIGGGKGRIDIGLDRVSVEHGLAEGVPVRLQAGEYARLAVADNGCGIAEQVLPHVFEPFFTTKPVGKGTGLGLSVIYGSLSRAGGDIIVDSKPGDGSRFDLFIPLLERVAGDARTNSFENGSPVHGQAAAGG